MFVEFFFVVLFAKKIIIEIKQLINKLFLGIIYDSLSTFRQLLDLKKTEDFELKRSSSLLKEI